MFQFVSSGSVWNTWTTIKQNLKLFFYFTLSSQTSIKPVHRKPVSGLSSPAFTETCRDTAVLPATLANKKAACQASPVGRPSIQMTPDTHTISGSDTTFSSDDEDFYSSASSSSSSLPSPEIFRRENDGVCACVPTFVSTTKLHSCFYSDVFVLSSLVVFRLLSSSQLKQWLSPLLRQISWVCILT